MDRTTEALVSIAQTVMRVRGCWNDGTDKREITRIVMECAPLIRNYDQALIDATVAELLQRAGR